MNSTFSHRVSLYDYALFLCIKLKGGTELDVKIYRTKDGQNFSLEPILNDGRYCTENECDIAGIYAIPKDIKIITSGGRLRFDGSVYLINDKGKPAIGIYKPKDGVLKLEKAIALEERRQTKIKTKDISR